MVNDVDTIADEVLRRVILNIATPEERERVAEGIAESQEISDTFSATEELIVIEYLQSRLAPQWEAPFRAAYLDTSRGRTRIAQIAALRAALPAPRRSRVPYAWLAAAAAIAVIVAGSFVSLRRGNETTVAPGTTGSPAPTDTVFTVTLMPGLTRSDAAGGNVFRVPRDARAVRLQWTIDADRADRIGVTLRRVGDPLPPLIEGVPDARRDGSRTYMTWVVPASRLSPNDYLVTVTAESSPGVRDTIGTRFFSIVE